MLVSQQLHPLSAVEHDASLLFPADCSGQQVETISRTLSKVNSVSLTLCSLVPPPQPPRHLLLLVHQPLQVFFPPGVAQLQEVHHPGAAAAHHGALPRTAHLHAAGGALQQDCQWVTRASAFSWSSSAESPVQKSTQASSSAHGDIFLTRKRN